MVVLSKNTISKNVNLLSVSMKHLGRGQALVNIQTASIEELQKMCASERAINVNFQVELAGGIVRHISLCFFDSREYGGKTTYEERLALVMELRQLDLSQFMIEVVGSTAFGKAGSKFVALICHLGKYQEWFIETRNRGDKEWGGSAAICHISTCWGWNGDEFTLRGNDEFTAEHAWTLALITQVGNFLVAEDNELLEKFNQLVNISDDETEVSA